MFDKAIELLKILENHGEAYIVGGAVRDYIMGIDSNDIDIATNVSMEIIESLFDTYDIGKNKDFGIVCIRHEEEQYEIAQFRVDSDYSDGRHPDKVIFASTLKEDVIRRDFTINGLAMDSNRNIIDYVGGVDDIKNKTVRAIGNAEQRFQEDYLRMLRAVRFASRFGFDLDENTSEAIKNNSEKITQIPNERVYGELKKMASNKNFGIAIEMLSETNLLKIILPEIEKMKRFEHHPIHHPEGGVFDHTLSALKFCGDDYISNLAILFHDVGKPVSYKNRDGKHTYFGHESNGVGVFHEIANSLKMDDETKDIISFCIENHMKTHLFGKMKKHKAKRIIDHKYWKYLLAVYIGDNFSSGLDEITLKDRYLSFCNAIIEMSKTPTVDEIRKKVNGDLVKILRPKSKGKQIGDIIDRSINAIINRNINISDNVALNRIVKGV